MKENDFEKCATLVKEEVEMTKLEARRKIELLSIAIGC
jgi:hypothetical protein